MRLRAAIDPLDAPGLDGLGEKPRTQNSSGILMGTRRGFTPDQAMAKFGASPPRLAALPRSGAVEKAKITSAASFSKRTTLYLLRPEWRSPRSTARLVCRKPNPTAHSSKVAVMLGHSSDVINHSARHQTEISGVQRQADIGKPS